MGKVYEGIDDELTTWLTAQPVFFVGTAPRADDGHVNVSPKGMDGSFAVLGPNQVGYLDYFGSGAETIAHLRENGRIVLMFCSFGMPPKIVRLHGRGRVLRDGDDGFATVRARFTKPRDHGLRSVVLVDVDRVADSCGYSVPLMEFVAHRDTLDRVQAKRPDGYFDQYAIDRNAESIDALPALG